jgi:hypothetical protein
MTVSLSDARLPNSLAFTFMLRKKKKKMPTVAGDALIVINTQRRNFLSASGSKMEALLATSTSVHLSCNKVIPQKP